jgi:hypothetical protein
LHIEKDRGRPKLYANNSKAKEDFGMDIEVCQWTKFLSQRRIDIHMQMEWKPSNCLSNELAIATVMAENEYELVINKEIVKDLVVDGIAWNYTRLNPSKGIIIKRIDPADMVYSDTKDPRFKDCFTKDTWSKF